VLTLQHSRGAAKTYIVIIWYDLALLLQLLNDGIQTDVTIGVSTETDGDEISKAHTGQEEKD
jgi:hypothetical protein